MVRESFTEILRYVVVILLALAIAIVLNRHGLLRSPCSQPENILVDKAGKHLKLADFGSCRGINGKPPFTEYISTRWYRPPECLLTCGRYGPEMDVWGVGCILFELTTLYPLFPGTDEADQIKRIHRVLGTPDPSVLVKLKKHASTQANFAFPSQRGIGLAKLLPDAVANFLDLLTQSLAYEASTRITSRKAMKHSYFVGDSPFPTARFKVANDTKEMNSRTNHLTLSSKVESSKTSDLKQSETKPVTKTRSMVSILLARSDKNDFINESKARNNTFYRKKINSGSDDTGDVGNSKATSRTNLPKLKTLLPGSKETKRKELAQPPKHKPRARQPKKYAHVRSSGYGGSTAATSTSSKTLPTLPSLSNSKSYGFLSKKTEASRLPPVAQSNGRLGRGFR
eukprot:scaffold858_cov193-Alexandrium_tamarense.AAC.17